MKQVVMVDQVPEQLRLDLNVKISQIKNSFCYPNWGDKIRDTTPYIEQWDDGNNSNFDGWSKDCKVEFNYVCNPSPGQGDICTTIYDKPKILSASFDVTTTNLLWILLILLNYLL